MAAPRKRQDLRQDNRPERALTVIDGDGPVDVPSPMSTWSAGTKRSWATFWTSSVATVIKPEQHDALFRLFEMRDLQTRALARYRKQPYVDGSTGQPVTNPSFADATKLETQICALEDRLGLTPKALANLGIAVGQAALTAADLNRMASEASPVANAHDTIEVDGWEAVD